MVDEVGGGRAGVADRFADVYRAEFATFLQVATGAAASPCTPAEALEVAWIAEAATRSWQEHRSVRMAEIRTSRG